MISFIVPSMEFAKLLIERIDKEFSLSQLRKVVHVLLDAGADPNAEHDSVIKGYTPLMLVAEIDEVELFEKMLDCGGSPYKSYECPRTRRQVDCWSIAVDDNFKSDKILSFLKQRFPSK